MLLLHFYAKPPDLLKKAALDTATLVSKAADAWGKAAADPSVKEKSWGDSRQHIKKIFFIQMNLRLKQSRKELLALKALSRCRDSLI